MTVDLPPSVAGVPLAPPRAAIVVSTMLEQIVSGHYPAGSTLPREAEVSLQFGVSRTVVREALKDLQAKGLARIRQGSGTTVLPMADWDLLDSAVVGALLRQSKGLRILADLIQVRLALEPELVSEAVRHRTATWIDELDRLVEAMTRALGDPDRYGPLESSFHLKLAEGSGNVVGFAILNEVWSPLHLGRERWTDRLNIDAADIKTAHEAHLRIVRQVKRGNPVAAGKATREHIAAAWAWVWEALDQAQD